jgi:hypothetical protein
MSEKRKKTDQAPEKAQKYGGTLAEAINGSTKWADIADPSGRLKTAMIKQVESERSRKLKDLCDWYKIPWDSENRWELLAVALACAHVPGMRITPRKVERRGRPRKWVPAAPGTELPIEARELLRDVEYLRSEKGLTVKDAIEKLSQDETKKWHRFSLTPDVLLARYWDVHAADAKKQNVAAFFSQIDPETSPWGGLYKALIPPFPTDENS